MATRLLSISVPPKFNFWRTVRSHGWYDLPPFQIDPDTETLNVVLLAKDGVPVRCTLNDGGNSMLVQLHSALPLGKARISDAIRQVRSCLRLDEDLSGFHAAARRHPSFRWIAASGTGRLLRAPTVFEDLVKTICTTNCTWALTRIMTSNLVTHLGPRVDGFQPAFPTPAVIASRTERYLRSTIKMGYRAPYILELAERVASGSLEPETWRSSSSNHEEILKSLYSIKGIGPYAAGNVLRLLGKYDLLALDSWVRAKYFELHHGGRTVKDVTIERRYRQFGEWSGLFFWLEMTRDWHDEKFPGPSNTRA